ncbi:hypothetical protein Q7P37_009218 [Cladosporium fusiforme]
MGPLQFPEKAPSILERAYTGASNNSDYDKWLIYLASPDVSDKDARHLYQDAMKAYNDQYLGEPESEWEEQGFLKPADKSPCPPRDLQSIFEHHLTLVERQHSSVVLDDPQQLYKLGFIAITSPFWREQGVTVVHCDKDRGKWKVTQCKGVPVEQLGLELTSVSDLYIDFDEVRDRYDQGGDNSGPDNTGGPAPVGLWQFAVFCVGVSQSKAEDSIPDPRGDPSYPMGEGSLWFLPPQNIATEELKENWPLVYANAIRDPFIPGNPSQRRITTWHPSLFAIVNGDARQLIEIMQFNWDQQIERPDDELRRIGRESQMTTHTCDPTLVVSTLDKMANDGSIGDQ